MRIIEHFDNAVRFYPNNLAFVDVGNDAGALTYAQAANVTQAIAGAITHNGFNEGGHVGILAPNCSVAFLALLGVFRARCVWLPVNPRNTVAANAELFSDFDGELLLFHSVYAKEAALRSDLFLMRDAIDQYYADKGKYPESLQALVTESYLRAIPRDPFTNSSDTWTTTAADPQPGQLSSQTGVYEVKSGSDLTGSDGTRYADW